MLAGCFHIVREFMLSVLAGLRTQVLGQYTHATSSSSLAGSSNFLSPNLRQATISCAAGQWLCNNNHSRSSQRRSYSSIHRAYYANASQNLTTIAFSFPGPNSNNNIFPLFLIFFWFYMDFMWQQQFLVFHWLRTKQQQQWKCNFFN